MTDIIVLKVIKFSEDQLNLFEIFSKNLNPIAYGIFSFFQLRGGGGGAFWPAPQKTQLGQSD